MNAATAPAWRVHLEAPAESLSTFEAALASLGGALVIGGPDAAGRVPMDLYLSAAPDHADLVARLAAAALAERAPMPEVAIEALGVRDWVAENRREMPAIVAGPFYIYGAHNTEPPPPGAIALQVEASAAFGTGRHESTQGCLLALADLAAAPGHPPPGNALDMGCGTGLLAMAMARLWGCPVLAVDSDEDAARLASENARRNGLADMIRVERGEGYGAPVIARESPFDLIVANILAEPLCAMAPDLIRHLAPGGIAILSGLLADQEERVLAAHSPLALRARVPLGSWVTLVLDAGPERTITIS